MLKEIELPKELTIIENDLFHFCKSIKKDIIHEKVIKIGDNAFSNCESLTNIYIPQYVHSFGNDAFLGCFSVEQILLFQIQLQWIQF